MKRQVMVVGLGQFGMALTRVLTERGVEVLAIDVDEARVRVASSYAADVLCFDATDEDALAQAAPERRDVCVCAIGDEAREASIVCTALLKQMGAKLLVARVSSDLHERILRLVGADVVVNPERAFGEGFANNLIYERVKGELNLGGDLLITELEVPPSFVGRTLLELQLPRRYQLSVVALRRAADPGTALQPDPKHPFASGDIIVVVGPPEAAARMLERI
ncbi:MAG: TrkA family potassium uptake protein [Polyangiaceae bacterium]